MTACKSVKEGVTVAVVLAEPSKTNWDGKDELDIVVVYVCVCMRD